MTTETIQDPRKTYTTNAAITFPGFPQDGRTGPPKSPARSPVSLAARTTLQGDPAAAKSAPGYPHHGVIHRLAEAALTGLRGR